jgi:hypothetical protein
VAGNAKGLTASVIKAAAQASNGWAGYRALQLRYSYLQPRPGVTVPEQAAVRFGWVTDETIDLCAVRSGTVATGPHPIAQRRV